MLLFPDPVGSRLVSDSSQSACTRRADAAQVSNPHPHRSRFAYDVCSVWFVVELSLCFQFLGTRCFCPRRAWSHLTQTRRCKGTRGSLRAGRSGMAVPKHLAHILKVPSICTTQYVLFLASATVFHMLHSKCNRIDAGFLASVRDVEQRFGLGDAVSAPESRVPPESTRKGFRKKQRTNDVPPLERSLRLANPPTVAWHSGGRERCLRGLPRTTSALGVGARSGSRVLCQCEGIQAHRLL